MKTEKFSVNIDESTSSNNEKIVTVLLATLTYRQQVLSGCKMLASESIKPFNSRVINASLKFLGKVDLTNGEINLFLTK